MGTKFDRTKRLLGEEAMIKLKNAHVAVFGIGGVGGHAADALVRSGIGEITIVDSDEIAESNINRQLIATTKTVGRKKVDVMKERILDINPNAIVEAYRPDEIEGGEAATDHQSPRFLQFRPAAEVRVHILWSLRFPEGPDALLPDR